MGKLYKICNVTLQARRLWRCGLNYVIWRSKLLRRGANEFCISCCHVSKLNRKLGLYGSLTSFAQISTAFLGPGPWKRLDWMSFNICAGRKVQIRQGSRQTTLVCIELPIKAPALVPCLETRQHEISTKAYSEVKSSLSKLSYRYTNVFLFEISMSWHAFFNRTYHTTIHVLSLL